MISETAGVGIIRQDVQQAIENETMSPEEVGISLIIF